MKSLQQKISYLQGLTEGLDLEKSPEGKVISAMLDVLEDMADYVTCLQEDQDDLSDYVENLDSDLADLEDDFYELEDDYEADEDDFIEVVCPNCGEDVFFDRGILYDEDAIEVVCPACGAVVFDNEDFEGLEYECEEPCTCGCQDGHDIDVEKKEKKVKKDEKKDKKEKKEEKVTEND